MKKHEHEYAFGMVEYFTYDIEDEIWVKKYLEKKVSEFLLRSQIMTYLNIFLKS